MLFHPTFKCGTEFTIPAICICPWKLLAQSLPFCLDGTHTNTDDHDDVGDNVEILPLIGVKICYNTFIHVCTAVNEFMSLKSVLQVHRTVACSILLRHAECCKQMSWRFCDSMICSCALCWIYK